ncbi:MAG: acetate/propionate family kinase [Limnochordia bacterium]|jgi:acetate kinase
MLVLVLNSGGSSIKYRLFDMPAERIVAEGSVDGLGLSHARFTHNSAGEKWQENRPIPDHLAGFELIFAKLQAELAQRDEELKLIVHKLIHGGQHLGPVEILDERAIKEVERMAVVAAVHNVPALAGIEAVSKLAPKACQMGVFETGFFQTLPPYATVYGLPYELAQEHGLRKYGFHGASHRYISQRTPEFLGTDGPLRIISCHLGSGTSVAAILDGQGVEISSGYTPQSGTLMSTRPGDFDPEVLFYLLHNGICDLAQLRQMMNKASGLAGISGIPGGDLRDLEAAAAKGDRRAQLAIDAFCYSVRKYIGSFLIPLGGLDVLVFTGGIGENSSQIRAKICHGLEWLGIKLDPQANATEKCDALINAADSQVRIAILGTNEEIVVVRQAWQHWLAHQN